MPRAIGATWILLGFAMIIGDFGPIMDLPLWVHNLSPLEHIARLALAEFTWPAVVVLTAIATALVTLGLHGFRQRDVETR